MTTRSGFWVLLYLVSVFAAHAFDGPVEFPPASYSGHEYVDSRGCVFMRTGIGRRVDWVPRVDLQSRPVCGRPPTFKGRYAATIPAPAADPEAVLRDALTRPQCQDASPVSAEYINPLGGRLETRCGPQRRAAFVAAPRDMDLYWTLTSPSRLIDRKTGRDMTAQLPLVYPYIDYDTQTAKLGEVVLVSRNGVRFKRIDPKNTPAGREFDADAPVHSASALFHAQTGGSAAQQPATAKPGIGGYVQVGVFGVASNAEQAARRLRMVGLPARIETYRRAGKTFRSVRTGALRDAVALKAALHQIVALGFPDAYIRR